MISTIFNNIKYINNFININENLLKKYSLLNNDLTNIIHNKKKHIAIFYYKNIKNYIIITINTLDIYDIKIYIFSYSNSNNGKLKIQKYNNLKYNINIIYNYDHICLTNKYKNIYKIIFIDRIKIKITQDADNITYDKNYSTTKCRIINKTLYYYNLINYLFSKFYYTSYMIIIQSKMYVYAYYKHKNYYNILYKYKNYLLYI